jgi:hypothetical protein
MDCSRGRRLGIGDDALSMSRIRCAKILRLAVAIIHSLYTVQGRKTRHFAQGTHWHWPRDASYKEKRSGTPRSGTRSHWSQFKFQRG